jgi:Trk K+ transport system NAD-binding subunit
MKFLPSQFLFLIHDPRARRNIRALAKFIIVLAILITIYSVLFHYLMQLEGQEHSIVSGFYWTLVTMSTLGFGDITFTSDIGRAFSMVVILSGIIFLLVMLPFTFIRFFYAPWLEAQSKTRAPRSIREDTAGHVIITAFDPITVALVQRLKQFKHDYVIIIPDVQQALDLVDQGYAIMVGDLDDPDTYRRAQVTKAALVIALNDDMKNTNIVYTVRDIAPNVRVAANADLDDSVDILNLAGCSHCFQFMNMLGRSLARRTLGADMRSNIIGRFENLLIAEAPAMRTNLMGKTLRECGLREATGINVVGLWNRGRFTLPRPDTVIDSTTVLVLAGSENQLAGYDSFVGETGRPAEAPVLILGGGRVGRAAAAALAERGVDYRIVEKNPRLANPEDEEHYVIGSAADRETLLKAGIHEAPSVFITTHTDDVNIYLTIYCRRLRPDIQIISRATMDRNITILHSAGADLVMSHASMAANTILNLLSPGRVLMLTEGLNIFRVTVHPSLVRKSLVTSGIREQTGCSTIALVRGGRLEINPDPNTLLVAGDEMIVIGTADAEKCFMQRYTVKS